MILLEKEISYLNGFWNFIIFLLLLALLLHIFIALYCSEKIQTSIIANNLFSVLYIINIFIYRLLLGLTRLWMTKLL